MESANLRQDQSDVTCNLKRVICQQLRFSNIYNG